MTSYTQKAIELAASGGYDTKLDASYSKSDWQIFNEASFWRALGKSIGWYEWRCYCGTYYQGARKRKGLPQGVRPRICTNCGRDARMIKPAWQANWHRLIDALASGRDIESFFQALLVDKPTEI